MPEGTAVDDDVRYSPQSYFPRAKQRRLLLGEELTTSAARDDFRRRPKANIAMLKPQQPRFAPGPSLRRVKQSGTRSRYNAEIVGRVSRILR